MTEPMPTPSSVSEALQWFRDQNIHSPLTKKEAFAMYEQSKSYFLYAGRAIGKELCLRDGETHTRAVYQVMKERGFPVQHMDGRWLGALFNTKYGFRPTDRSYHPTDEDYADSKGGTHTHAHRVVYIWELAENPLASAAL